MDERRPVFVHVGCSKSGTTALQFGLWNSTDALAKCGVGLPLVGRREHMQRLLMPLGWTPGAGFAGSMRPARLRRLARRLADAPGDRLLISNEDLAVAGPEQIAAVREAAERAELDLRVVITARDWSRQLPSEWQQLLKERLTTDYPTFLDDVRNRVGAAAEKFWLRQDVLAIATRWAEGIDPAKVNVIAVGPSRIDPDGVFRSLSQVVGYDPAVLTLEDSVVNVSFGYVEAEVVRRLNLALGERLPSYRKDYVPAIRSILVSRVLARQASARIPLPPDHLEWVRELARERLDGLRARGFTLYGDPEHLVPGPDDAAPLPSLDEGEIAAAAIRTLANFAVRVHRDHTLSTPEQP